MGSELAGADLAEHSRALELFCPLDEARAIAVRLRVQADRIEKWVTEMESLAADAGLAKPSAPC